ncbi:MAG: hypothetical protein H7329_03305 [Opitutaceae bacterium]|nr:hypothetical protein [Cytophagales bacterium]
MKQDEEDGIKLTGVTDKCFVSGLPRFGNNSLLIYRYKKSRLFGLLFLFGSGQNDLEKEPMGQKTDKQVSKDLRSKFHRHDWFSITNLKA